VVLAPACALLIAAASDLAPLERAITAALPGCEVRISFASSGTLSRQIRHGAEFDLFLSASKAYIDALGDAADPSTITPYARGRIAVWSRKGLQWKDLRSAAHIAIANPVHAPYGLAARQALERQGLWGAVESRIVYGESVRQAWQFASTGNADVAVIAWSLVHRSGGQILPESWHDPILQVGVIPKRSRNLDAARRIMSWLTSEAGQKLLAGHGLERVR
jgi:molybdate transport system substrate-binding protein